LRESLNFEENDPQTYYNLAIAYLKLKEYKESFQFLQKSLALNPENNQARRLIEELNKKAGY
jgi:cytochrome c-type biogenesis protein CcmH/NrfG